MWIEGENLQAMYTWEVKNEVHFVLRCEALSEERRNLLYMELVDGQRAGEAGLIRSLPPSAKILIHNFVQFVRELLVQFIMTMSL